MSKQIHMNAFTMCSICFHSKGQWKHPLDQSSLGYKNVKTTGLISPRPLERGCFDTLFLADVHGTYNVYKGSRDHRGCGHSTQIPKQRPDPW